MSQKNIAKGKIVAGTARGATKTVGPINLILQRKAAPHLPAFFKTYFTAKRRKTDGRRYAGTITGPYNMPAPTVHLATPPHFASVLITKTLTEITFKLPLNMKNTRSVYFCFHPDVEIKVK